MIQDIPKTFRNEYTPVDPQGDDIVFAFQGHTFLAPEFTI